MVNVLLPDIPYSRAFYGIYINCAHDFYEGLLQAGTGYTNSFGNYGFSNVLGDEQKT